MTEEKKFSIEKETVKVIDISKEICELLRNLYVSVDNKDIKGFLETLSKEPVIKIGDIIYKGKEEIKKRWLESFQRNPNSKHILPEFELNVLGEEVKSYVYWIFSDDGKKSGGYGRDDIYFKKEDDKWKIDKVNLFRILDLKT